MRIVTWNCNMALHRKLDALAELRPDIAVLPESAHPDRVEAKSSRPLDHDAVWVGDNPNKGLSVLGFNGYRVALAPEHDPAIRHIAPVRVSGPSTFKLLAVWAINTAKEGWGSKRLAPFLSAMTTYDTFLSEGPLVVAGDFNNHVRWDKPGKPNNHANAVEVLRECGLASAYHAHHGVAQGDEADATLYWRDRCEDGPRYHIDYVFIPETWLADVRQMSVGSFEDWCGNKLSDHVPLVVDVG